MATAVSAPPSIGIAWWCGGSASGGRVAWVRSLLIGLSLLATSLTVVPPAVGQGTPAPTQTSQLLHRDVLIGADLWDRRPRMMAAGLGFTNIVGVPGITADDLAGSEDTVRAVGGAWNAVACATGETPGLNAYTSASTPEAVALTFGFPTTLSAGLPVEFSWPILPSTLEA